MAEGTTLGVAQVPIRATLDQLDKDLAGVRGVVDRALAGVQDLGRISLAGLAAGAVAVAGALAAIGPAAVNAASDLNESVSKANIVFGDAIQQVDTFASSSASSFGIARQAAYEAAGTFGNLFTTIGLGQSAAAGMSVDIVKLAADLASFNNLKVEDVLEKLRSGLVGETEPLRSLGVNINEAAVQAKALSMGLTKTAPNLALVKQRTVELAEIQSAASDVIKNYGANHKYSQKAMKDVAKAQAALSAAQAGGKAELTDAMKLQARYALILEQTKTAQGDFARTSDGLANTQRIQAAQWADLQAKIGALFLPVVLSARGALGTLAEAVLPKVEAGLRVLTPILDGISNSIGLFATVVTQTGDPVLAISSALSNFPDLKATFDGMVAGVQAFLASIQPIIDQVTAWLGQNIQLNDVLIALGIAIASVVVPALITAAATVAPIIAAFLLLVGIVALVRQAWTENWGGIRDTLTAFWEGMAKPALEQLWAWLQVNVPAAIQTLSNFWSTVLLPAIQAAWAFIQTNVFPMLLNLWTWLQVNVPAAIQTLTDFWNNTLMPAITAVWAFIQDYLLPLFISLVDLGIHIVQLAVETLSTAWTLVFLPAIQSIHKFMDEKLGPIFRTIADVVQNTLGKAFKWVSDNVFPAFEKAIDSITRGIQFLIGIIDDAIAALKRLTGKVDASPIMGHSPSPLELSIQGISAAMSNLSRLDIPSLSVGFEQMPELAPRSGSASSASARPQVVIYGLTLSGVQDAPGLLAELQALA